MQYQSFNVIYGSLEQVVTCRIELVRVAQWRATVGKKEGRLGGRAGVGAGT